MPQPTRSTALVPITTPVPAETQASVYCSGCHGFHGIDADVRSRWLEHVGVTQPDQLAPLDQLYWVLDATLRTVGPTRDAAPGRPDWALLDDVLSEGQELIEKLDQLLAPTSDDLFWMDVE